MLLGVRKRISWSEEKSLHKYYYWQRLLSVGLRLQSRDSQQQTNIEVLYVLLEIRILCACYIEIKSTESRVINSG